MGYFRFRTSIGILQKFLKLHSRFESLSLANIYFDPPRDRYRLELNFPAIAAELKDFLPNFNYLNLATGELVHYGKLEDLPNQITKRLVYYAPPITTWTDLSKCDIFMHLKFCNVMDLTADVTPFDFNRFVKSLPNLERTYIKYRYARPAKKHGSVPLPSKKGNPIESQDSDSCLLISAVRYHRASFFPG
ncbi:hypothetical protein M422DRAFT_44703 [Sphaerobolus stellatus SS14]|nr:hypothetical protein M422DRAFT_44703 [Sphaerobolus stellatus SS14]